MNLVTLFAALADRTRLRILNLVRRREVCVCYFVSLLDETQPKISRHLAYLRRAGIVNARRDGKWIHYSLARPNDAGAAQVLEATLDAVANDKQMQRDASMLERACCAVKLPPELEHAPRPQLTEPRANV
ncbi:MAG TPA: metalloregulator ArsR/SmtB family transcription factor [Thermoanaerobaculia bacterium]|nr:metalloregulator ArsR/SmtB family transcription factor [Thermoanaerobaculia bacterium]